MNLFVVTAVIETELDDLNDIDFRNLLIDRTGGIVQGVHASTCSSLPFVEAIDPEAELIECDRDPLEEIQDA